ncbi:MAG: hypothetical protein HYZ74_06940, partial [Elusimicrobia bacterium]|nr:hypothetical protein [Elusimicrobiota bacterium]
MICALLVDPDDSIDFPGNGAEVLGRPLAAYPLLAAPFVLLFGTRGLLLTNALSLGAAL